MKDEVEEAAAKVFFDDYPRVIVKGNDTGGTQSIEKGDLLDLDGI